MSENEIILDNILSEVMDYVRQLKTKKATFGGYDKEYALYTIQEICNLYEKHLAKIFSDNRIHFDMLNNEINELRLNNEGLARRTSVDPSVVEKANKSIAEANSRIEAANLHIANLQAKYDEAEAKLKEKDEYIEQLKKRLQSSTEQNKDMPSDNFQDFLRSDRPVQSQDIIDSKATADEIIKRARLEADRLRQLARAEAESIIRERRAEIRAEERLHEELLSELKSKYVKYRDLFTNVQSMVKNLDGDINPMINRHDEFKADSYESQDRISQFPWNDDYKNNFNKNN